MDPAIPFILIFSAAAAASGQAAIAEQYAARARQAQAGVTEPTRADHPPAVQAATLPAAPAARDAAATREFVEHWQNFMQPAVSRSPAADTTRNGSRR